MFKLASLFVEIVAETSSLDRALSRTHANLTTANVALGTFAGNVAASFARMAVGAAGGLFEGTVRSASHLAETMNKVQVVLGDGAAKVIANADDMAERFGYVKKEVLDAGSSFALLGREIGMSSGASADFGIKLTKMASDASSLADIELPQIMEKIRAGLAGQVRPLRELGIFMTANAVKEEAARMGLKPGASGQLSEGDKIKARVSFIENSEFMKKASDDLERTLGSTENQTRKFWGTLSNLATSVGQELNPAWNKLIIDINSGLGDLKGYFEANKSVIRGWADSVLEGFETAKVVFRNLPDVLEIALLGADQHMENALAKIETWATKVAVAIEKAFLKAGQATGDYYKTFAADPSNTVGSKLAEGLQSAVDTGKGLADSFSSWWDKGISRDAKRADFLFRPLRELNNFLERQEGVTEGHEQSVEDRVNRLQGIFSGPGKFLGGFSDYLKIYQDVAGGSIKAKPPDFTSSLINKADKHLAETLAQNTDISSKAIAAAQARIEKREAARLQALEDAAKAKVPPKKLTDDIFGPNKEDMSKIFRPGQDIFGPDKEGGDEDAAVLGDKTKHHKGLQDTASFFRNAAAEQLGGDVQDKQLTELQMIREADQKNAEMMEKMYNRTARAVYG